MVPEHERGLFIVFEGVDGSGKSSQLRAIEKLLIENGDAVTTTREPNGKIREMLMDEQMDKTTETLLFFADRCRNLKEVVLPALERGEIVLCDRYTLSSMVYQGLEGGQQKLVKRLIKEMNQIVTPDLIIFIDVDAEESFARRVNAGQTNRLDAINYNQQKKRVEYYCDLAASRSKMFGKYWITVNGRGEPKEVTERIQLMLNLTYGIPRRTFEQTVKGYFSLPENQLKDPMGPNRFIPTDEDDDAFSGKKTMLAGCSETASALNESKNIDPKIVIDYVLNSENEANGFVKNSNNHELLRTAVCDKVARGIRDISFRKTKSNQAEFQQLIGFVNYIFCCYPTGALFIQEAHEVCEFMGVTSNRVFSELLFNPCLNFLNPLIAECGQTAAEGLILPVEISQDCVKLRVAKLEAFANKKAKETFEALFSPEVINTLTVLLKRANLTNGKNKFADL